MSLFTRKKLKERSAETKVFKVMLDGGEHVYVREVKAKDAKILVKLDKMEGDESICRTVIMAACDDEGKSLYTEADYTSLLESPIRTLKQIADAFLEFNGFAGEDEELEKNSEAIRIA